MNRRKKLSDDATRFFHACNNEQQTAIRKSMGKKEQTLCQTYQFLRVTDHTGKKCRDERKKIAEFNQLGK
jgi:hypothetical protein